MAVSLLGWEPRWGSTCLCLVSTTCLTRAGEARGQPCPSISGLFVGGGKAERTRQEVARAVEGGARTRPGRRSRPCRRAAAPIGHLTGPGRILADARHARSGGNTQQASVTADGTGVL